MKISEINDSLKSVNTFARIEKVILSTGTNGQNYLILHLADRTGRVEARLWNAEDKDKTVLIPGKFLKFDANVNMYRQQLQLKLNSYIVIEESELGSYELSIDDFEVVAPLNIDSNYAKLIEMLEAISNPTYKAITLGLIQQYEVEFKTYPAAVSIHHNVIGGLFWHSFSLFMNIQQIKPNYDKFATVDWDLAYCGALLHDIGKIIEMKGKSAVDYTLEGKLLGHISIGNTMVFDKAKELNIAVSSDGKINEDVTKLQHLILSSHGKKEYGSPVEPVLLEGLIISSFDALDASIYRINDELSKVEKGNFTSRIMTEDGRMFYKHIEKK